MVWSLGHYPPTIRVLGIAEVSNWMNFLLNIPFCGKLQNSIDNVQFNFQEVNVVAFTQ